MIIFDRLRANEYGRNLAADAQRCTRIKANANHSFGRSGGSEAGRGKVLADVSRGNQAARRVWVNGFGGFFDRRKPERTRCFLVKRLENLGYKVTFGSTA